jgi:FkbM family methyltransferase
VAWEAAGPVEPAPRGSEHVHIQKTALNTLIALLRGGSHLLGQRSGDYVSLRIAEGLMPTVTVETPRGALRFYCPGTLPLWRADTLLTKEPETIEWIDTFRPGDVLWDIGANVGLYTLYAALKPDIQVLAFEPAAVNHFVLNRNIELNRMDERVSAFCLAFADQAQLARFYMGSTEIGGACHNFAEAADWEGKPLPVAFKQAMVGYTIDEFIERFKPQFPTNIKIDVDGIEDKIIAGAPKTLADPRLKSLMVELNIAREPYFSGVKGLIEKAGLKLQSRRRSEIVEQSIYSNVYNCLFRRD